MWEKRIFPQLGIVHFGNGSRSRCHPLEFVQSHIGERHLMNFFYNVSRISSHPCFISIWPKEWCTIVCVRHCRRNSWGVFPRCGIEQIREGGIDSSAHSQSKKYLIGKKFVPPTIIFLAIILSSMFDLILFLLIKILSLLN